MTAAPDPRPTPARRVAPALLWLAATAPGCGDPGPTVPLHPTTGQVLLRGKPLEGIQVSFRPVTAGEGRAAPVAVARTDREGKFRLVTAVGVEGRTLDGAPAGDYAVALAPPGRSDSRDFLNKDATRSTASPLGSAYADAKTSGLKATVKPGENTLEPFDLKDDGPASNPGVTRDGRGR